MVVVFVATVDFVIKYKWPRVENELRNKTKTHAHYSWMGNIIVPLHGRSIRGWMDGWSTSLAVE